MDWVLIVLFFLIAFLYSSAGFGGGSLYLAVLGQQSIPVATMRSLALLCNMTVTGVSLPRYFGKRLLPLRRNLMLVLCSIPFVFVGATARISASTFYLLLAIALLLAGIAISVQRKKSVKRSTLPQWIIFPLASAAGLLAGLTGIGGGVYLSPVMYFLRWGNEREIAASSSFFIAINSLVGIAGLVWSGQLTFVWESLFLIAAVLLGGWIGSHLASKTLNVSALRYLTSGILIFAALRIIYLHL